MGSPSPTTMSSRNTRSSRKPTGSNFHAANDQGALKLLAIDVANDLAIVQTRRRATGASRLRPALARRPRRTASSSMRWAIRSISASPSSKAPTTALSSGATTPRIHFSGAINPGMSGGPAVTAKGNVAGINVAKRLDGELVSFLVPAQYAARCSRVRRAKRRSSLRTLRDEIDRQLAALAGRFLSRARRRRASRPARFGPYHAPESTAPWFNCWAPHQRRPDAQTARAARDDELQLREPTLHRQDMRSAMPSSRMPTCAASISIRSSSPPTSRRRTGCNGRARWREKWYTPPRCTQDFARAAQCRQSARRSRRSGAPAPIKDFPDLYDVALTTVTQDRSSEALVSRLSLQAVTYEAAQNLGKQFLEALQWHE